MKWSDVAAGFDREQTLERIQDELGADYNVLDIPDGTAIITRTRSPFSFMITPSRMLMPVFHAEDGDNAEENTRGEKEPQIRGELYRTAHLSPQRIRGGIGNMLQAFFSGMDFDDDEDDEEEGQQIVQRANPMFTCAWSVADFTRIRKTADSIRHIFMSCTWNKADIVYGIKNGRRFLIDFGSATKKDGRAAYDSYELYEINDYSAHNGFVTMGSNTMRYRFMGRFSARDVEAYVADMRKVQTAAKELRRMAGGNITVTAAHNGRSEACMTIDSPDYPCTIVIDWYPGYRCGFLANVWRKNPDGTTDDEPAFVLQPTKMLLPDLLPGFIVGRLLPEAWRIAQRRFCDDYYDADEDSMEILDNPSIYPGDDWPLF